MEGAGDAVGEVVWSGSGGCAGCGMAVATSEVMARKIAVVKKK